MLLNSTSISQFVTESPFSKRTQIGIDLSVRAISRVEGTSHLYVDKTSILPDMYETIDPKHYRENNKTGWLLTEGVYSVTFNEGVKIPENAAAIITHRSSLYRTGNSINSPWWDPGFYCENMNTTLIIRNPVFIEQNARLAQITFWKCEKPEELYDGQFQGASHAHSKSL